MVEETPDGKMIVFNIKDTKEKRRLLRKDQTEAEKKLWENLRNKRFHGFKFFRQYGIGHYIADFYCPELKLVVEVDGARHFLEEGIGYDKEREGYFMAAGIRTLRFSNQDVLKNTEEVLERLGAVFLPPPSLIKRGVRGEFKKGDE